MSDGATLIVTRMDERDIRFREALVLLNGKEIANLKYGDTLEQSLKSGTYTVQATNRVFKSAVFELELKEGERAEFSTGNVPNGCFGFLMILQMAPPTIFLKRTGDARD